MKHLAILALLALAAPLWANGYRAAAPPAFAPACSSCAPAAQFAPPQAQINYVPRTQFSAETVYEPRTVLRAETVYEPQLTVIPPAAPVYAPRFQRAPCHAQQFPARNFDFAPYAPQAFRAPVRVAPVRARAPKVFVPRVPVYGGFSADVVTGGPVAQTRRGTFAQGNPGGEVVIREGGLRGVFLGRAVRAR